VKIRLFPSRLSGIISAVASKSHAHRAMICAALSDRPTDLHLSCISQDIEVTASCLNALGASVKLQENGAFAIKPAPTKIQQAELDCKESGSTLRFLLPVAGAICEKTYFTGGGRLPERPLGPLVEAMESHSCRFVGRKLPFTVHGIMTGGCFELPGNVSSQFISGVLLVLPLLNGGEVELTTGVESTGYLRMTVDTMARFGVNVEKTKQGYRVAARARYRSPGSLTVEGDWSNAAVWLAIAAIGKEICITGLSLNSTQGDKEIVALLRASGVEIQVEGDKTTAKPASEIQLPPIIDAGDIPDLIPVLAALALYQKGETRVVNAGRLRLKESDRLSCLARELRKLGGDIKEMSDGLVIRGTGRLRGGTADGCGDHRIVMALTVASTISEAPVLIEGAQAIEKSYPDFFSDFVNLGGKLSIDA
jgi:3-phosphoshikimate 1-carboxyvinyltransferase